MSLGARSVDAVFWGAGGAALRLVVQLGAQITLARLLGPEQYGVFAIGAIVIGFSAFFSDIGLAYGLIQKTDVGSRDVRFVFTWQVILGTTVTLAICLASAPLARFLGDGRAAPVLAVLSAVCLLNALAAPSLNLLKRELDFRTIQLAQLAGYVAGYVLIGIPLALNGAQAWALVAAWLTQAAVSGLLLYRATRHDLRPLLWYEQARAQSGYGGLVFVTNLVNWLINNVDRVTVGRSFGSRDIGLYATSFNLLYNPTMTALGVVQPVFFAAASRTTDSKASLLEAYKGLVGGVAIFALPLFACMAVVADTLFGALYGARWLSAAPLFRPLALAMPVMLCWGLSTPVLWTASGAAREFQIQAPLTVLWVLGCAAAAAVSVVAVAWTVLMLQLLRCILVSASAVRSLGLKPAAMWVVLRGGIGLSLVVAATVGLADLYLPPVLPPVLRLAADAAAALATWYALLRLMPGLVPGETAGLLSKAIGRIPIAVSVHLGFLARRGGPA